MQISGLCRHTPDSSELARLLEPCSSLLCEIGLHCFSSVCGRAREGLGGAVGAYWVSLIKAVSVVSAKECADHETAYVC